ncbi:acetate--CoA ligase family protein [Ramlibacter sp.]|uniref:acetate--CoA ligase family protein n=1 Tax=Ramlibacter sp. TaxID=1917967 RepID=UPI003D0AAE4F
MSEALQRMFNPRSIAVIGASNDPNRIGGQPIELLKKYFKGAIYAVNPTRDTVQGLKTYPSIGAVDGPVDLVIVALPAKSVQGAVEECIAKGIDACVVFSSGFAEEGPDGVAMQEKLVATARAAGMRLMGPNCLGIGNNRLGSWATFAGGAAQLPPVGGLSIVAQSGGFASYALMLMKKRQLGLAHWIVLGNQAEADFADCIDYLADDPDTKVILGYLEGIADGPKLVEALKKARRNRKPVVVVKVGSSEAGGIATASHTATLAGEDAVYDAALRQYGAYRAETVHEAFNVAYACMRSPGLPKSNRTGIITVSGGFGVLMADTAERAGLTVPALPDDTQQRLKQILPFSNVRNPVDITAQIRNDFSLFTRTVDEVFEQDACDMAVIYQMGVDYTHMRPLVVESLTNFRKRKPDSVLALILIATDEIRRGYEDLGFMVFEEPSESFRPLAALRWFAQSFEKAAKEEAAVTSVKLPPLPALPAGAATLDEKESKALFAAAGLPVPAEHSARTEDEAIAAAESIGYPVVLKVLSRDLVHKSDVGGVELDIRNADQLRTAFRRMHDNVSTKAPGARIDGVLVAPMISGGLEFSLGVQNDPVFGPTVMVGLGGIFIEVLEDVAFRHAPVSRDEARGMLRELRGAKMLDGVRGKPAADVDALVDAIVKLSALAASGADRIASIDINPLIVLPAGRGAFAVDGVVQLRETA